jgi:hypothetical protein
LSIGCPTQRRAIELPRASESPIAEGPDPSARMKRTHSVIQLCALPAPSAPREANLSERGTTTSAEALVKAGIVGAGGVEPPSSSVSGGSGQLATPRAAPGCSVLPQLKGGITLGVVRWSEGSRDVRSGKSLACPCRASCYGSTLLSLPRSRHDQAPRRSCMDAGATNGAAVRLLGYRQRMRSQLSLSRLGFQATRIQRPRRSKARAPTSGCGPAVPAATRPNPTPGHIKGTPHPCGGLRPHRPAVSTLPRRRFGENRRRVR